MRVKPKGIAALPQDVRDRMFDHLQSVVGGMHIFLNDPKVFRVCNAEDHKKAYYMMDFWSDLMDKWRTSSEDGYEVEEDEEL